MLCFLGQLPQPYDSSYPKEATKISRASFNDQNKQERNRFISNPNKNCDYIVDLEVSIADQTNLEPNFAKMHPEIWKPEFSAKFLNAKRSPTIFRAFYFPYYSEKLCSFNNYIIYKNVKKLHNRNYA